MNNLDFRRTTTRPVRRAVSAPLYAIGQTVQLRSHTQTPGRMVYTVTALLPERDRIPQYRIRNRDEGHERVVSQDQISPVAKAPANPGGDLIRKTFG